MTTKTTRKIIKIDEEKCNGCGACVPACVEGALRIIDGKARLKSEKYCDGLGACLGDCPQGALEVVEAEAEDFDEEAVKAFQEQTKVAAGFYGCPGATIREFERKPASLTQETTVQESALTQWPIQLTLVPPFAPFLQGADVLLTAQCVPFSYADFHKDFLRDHALLIACPKLDDLPAHLVKLTQIIKQADIKSITVVHMEVPCCSGLVYIAREAIKASGKDIPLNEVTIGVRGDLKSRS